VLRKLRPDELHILNDDPVRPHIDHHWRIRSGKAVYVLDNGTGGYDAVLCTALMDEVPTCEADMKWPGMEVAVFYTVWSYERGAGRRIIFDTAAHMRKKNPWIKRWVTLSPLTEMAERFHLRNGARLLKRHSDCQNFEYDL
jgi:hypothetical protein